MMLFLNDCVCIRLLCWLCCCENYVKAEHGEGRGVYHYEHNIIVYKELYFIYTRPLDWTGKGLYRCFGCAWVKNIEQLLHVLVVLHQNLTF